MTISLDRGFTSGVNSTLTTDQMSLVPVLFLNFPNALQKYFSGASTDITITSGSVLPQATYIAAGGISKVNAVEESIDLKASGLSVTLVGLDSTYVSTVLSEAYFGEDAILGLVLLNPDGTYKGAPDEPIILFQGFMSNMEIAMSQGKADITVTIESIFRDWERPRVRRYNSGTQKLIDNSDRGFDNVPDLVSKELIWR